MIALGHAATGAMVGLASSVVLHETQLPLSVMVLPALLASAGAHYVGDFIPHGHYKFDVIKAPKTSVIKLALDFGVANFILMAVSFIQFGFTETFWLIVIGLIGVQLPDIFEGLIDLKIIPNTAAAKEHRAFHYNKLHWHRQSDSPLPNGARPLTIVDTYQLGLFVLACWMIVALSA